MRPEPPDFIRFVNRLTGHMIDGEGCPSSEAQNSAVYTHIKNSGHIFNPEEVVVLDKEERWFERGVREQFGREWSNHHLTRKGDYFFSCHMHAWDGPGTEGHSLTSIT